MTYCHCEAVENHFSQAYAEQSLRDYKKSGPHVATRILIEALNAQDLEGSSLLDVGGGIGAIMHELFPAGISKATLIEMASAYLTQAEEEARRRGYHDTVTYVHGDFIEVADDIPEVEIVTMDRVVCCYPDLERLIETSARKSTKWYALSYPRNRWYVRMGVAVENWLRHRRGDPFRTYMHGEEQINELITSAGFERFIDRTTWTWRIAIYRRRDASGEENAAVQAV